jgi:HlyD family secretion protein
MKNKVLSKRELPLIPASHTLETYMAAITTGSRMIYWIIIILIATAISIMPFVYTDISVVAPGYFQSEIEKQRIIIPLQGKIIRASVKNGSRIEKGDTMFIIDSESSRARKRAAIMKMSDNLTAIHDLEILTSAVHDTSPLDKNVFQTGRYYMEYSSMVKSGNIQMEKFRRIKAEFERNRFLFSKELIPLAEYENSLSQFRTEEENLNQVLVSYKSQWQTDLMQRKTISVTLQAELHQCNEDLENRVIIAPVSGEIIQSIDIQEGSFVGVNQQVAEISPDGQLIGTCIVNPGDIGLINPDQKVRIQVNAFNYNEWGLLNATITDISDDMIIENGTSAYFRIKCLPEKGFLTLKNGFKADLKKGMSFNARIIITRRSLFNLMFDKVDKWLNPNLNSKNIV